MLRRAVLKLTSKPQQWQRTSQDRYATLSLRTITSDERDAEIRIAGLLSFIHIIHTQTAPLPISPFLIFGMFDGFAHPPDARFISAVDEDKYRILQQWFRRDLNVPLSPSLKDFLREALDNYVSTCTSSAATFVSTSRRTTRTFSTMMSFIRWSFRSSVRFSSVPAALGTTVTAGRS